MTEIFTQILPLVALTSKCKTYWLYLNKFSTGFKRAFFL